MSCSDQNCTAALTTTRQRPGLRGHPQALLSVCLPRGASPAPVWVLPGTPVPASTSGCSREPGSFGRSPFTGVLGAAWPLWLFPRGSQLWVSLAWLGLRPVGVLTHPWRRLGEVGVLLQRVWVGGQRKPQTSAPPPRPLSPVSPPSARVLMEQSRLLWWETPPASEHREARGPVAIWSRAPCVAASEAPAVMSPRKWGMSVLASPQPHLS